MISSFGNDARRVQQSRSAAYSAFPSTFQRSGGDSRAARRDNAAGRMWPSIPRRRPRSTWRTAAKWRRARPAIWKIQTHPSDDKIRGSPALLGAAHGGERPPAAVSSVRHAANWRDAECAVARIQNLGVQLVRARRAEAPSAPEAYRCVPCGGSRRLTLGPSHAVCALSMRSQLGRRQRGEDPNTPNSGTIDRYATQNAPDRYSLAVKAHRAENWRAATRLGTGRCLELLRDYAAKVGEPLNQVNEMLLDEDLVSVREELRLREEYKARARRGSHRHRHDAQMPDERTCRVRLSPERADRLEAGLFGMPGLRNRCVMCPPSCSVEWKD